MMDMYIKLHTKTKFAKKDQIFGLCEVLMSTHEQKLIFDHV